MTRHRNLTAIGGAMALIVVMLIVQMWLLSATLDSFLAEWRAKGYFQPIPAGVKRLWRDQAAFTRHRGPSSTDR